MEKLKKDDIIKLCESEAIELLLKIKKFTLDACLEDTRSCREFAEYMKEIFVDEYE